MYDDLDYGKVVKYSIIGVIIVFIIITLFASFKSVPTGYVGVKTQLPSNANFCAIFIISF